MTAKIEFVSQGTVTSPRGFLAGAAYGGINKHARFKLDIGLLLSQTPCQAAAVFTRNQLKGAAVVLCQKRLPGDGVHAVIVNSGCANAGTGEQGFKDAAAMADIAAVKLGINPASVLMSSTGVIGQYLPLPQIKEAAGRIQMTEDGGHDLARAIMTTDTHPKEVAVTAGGFTIGGIAKGSGMIHPDMATMLCFITTDAIIESSLLQSLLKEAASGSLNMISVDGDTSPNDTALVMANGLSGVEVKAGTAEAALFQEALEAVCVYLAKELARDGEGATRLIEATVRGAKSVAEARDAARTIVSSNLVKTAVHGADPNWGRVVAAAGRSQATVDENRVGLSICSVPVVKDGMPLSFDRDGLSALLKQKEVSIDLDLNLGDASATAWGCDLSAEYVAINADYTT